MAIEQLVEVPVVMSGCGYNVFWDRFQLVKQLRKLSEYEKEPDNCGGCYFHSYAGVDLQKKDDAIIDALWLLLEAVFSVLEAQHDEAELGEFEPEVHLKVRPRRKKKHIMLAGSSVRL